MSHKHLLTGVAALAVIAFSGALFSFFFLVDAVTPGNGQQAVLVHKPILFGSEGVDPTPVNTGRHYVWWTTDHIVVDMLPYQKTLPFDDLMSSDGVPLDFESTLGLQVLNSVDLIGRFGVGWYENNIEKEVANRVRQAVRRRGMNETAIDTKAIDEIDTEVTAAIREYIQSIQMPVSLTRFTVGKANPPDAIKTQRIETAQQQQRILSETQRKLAEDARKLAETSRASADNAYREAMSLSPDQFLQLENIKMQKEACAKGGTCTFLIGGGTVPTYNLSKK